MGRLEEKKRAKKPAAVGEGGKKKLVLGKQYWCKEEKEGTITTYCIGSDSRKGGEGRACGL